MYCSGTGTESCFRCKPGPLVCYPDPLLPPHAADLTGLIDSSRLKTLFPHNEGVPCAAEISSPNSSSEKGPEHRK